MWFPPPDTAASSADVWRPCACSAANCCSMMMNELPRGATTDQQEAHLLFFKSAADISSIVGHTCGVERAGKGYKQVLSSLNERLWRSSGP